MRLASWLRGDVPVARLNPLRQRCLAAYDGLDELPRGPKRRSAWAAYALVTYSDKLLDAGGDPVERATAAVASQAYALAADGTVPRSLPRWGPGARSERQLRGMQDALVALQTFLAYDARETADPHVVARLAALEARLSTVARLWIPRPTPELRGGIGDALLAGLDEAYLLGLDLAAEVRVGSESR